MADYLTRLFGLRDKVVALTGGGGHICGTLARAFAAAGAKVCAATLPLEVDETQVIDGLTAIPSLKVQPPRLQEAAVSMECQLVDKKEDEDHSIQQMQSA